MGLHQRITDRTTSEPCNCEADDDHAGFEPEGHVYTEADAEDQLRDYDEPQPLEEEEEAPEGKGFTTT